MKRTNAYSTQSSKRNSNAKEIITFKHKHLKKEKSAYLMYTIYTCSSDGNILTVMYRISQSIERREQFFFHRREMIRFSSNKKSEYAVYL